MARRRVMIELETRVGRRGEGGSREDGEHWWTGETQRGVLRSSCKLHSCLGPISFCLPTLLHVSGPGKLDSPWRWCTIWPRACPHTLGQKPQTRLTIDSHCRVHVSDVLPRSLAQAQAMAFTHCYMHSRPPPSTTPRLHTRASKR